MLCLIDRRPNPCEIGHPIDQEIGQRIIMGITGMTGAITRMLSTAG